MPHLDPLSPRLRPYQRDAIQAALEAILAGQRVGLWVMPTGCHRKGQGVLLWDGTVKAVEDVAVGDCLMGPDGNARTVVQLCRGQGEMVKICPVKGKPWVVNKDHVLTLVKTSEKSNSRFPCRRGGQMVDVSVREWMGWSKWKKSVYKLFRVPIDFGAQSTDPPVRTGFTVQDLGTTEDYYGFTLTGDGRYLLDDFTVTHNTGKTICFVELARALAVPTLILVHRDELIGQTVDKLGLYWPGAKVGVVKAERNEWGGGLFGPPDVVIASVQSLTERRLSEVPHDLFGLLVVDEAHHGVANSYVRAVEHFHTAFRLGVTATPDRLDGVGLAKWFGREALYHYSLIRAIEEAYLVRVTQRAVVTDTKLDSVASVGGDFRPDQLASVVNTQPRNRAVAEAFREHAFARRGVAFCVDVQHCYDLALEFGSLGIRAGVVTGSMKLDERREILKRFREGKIQVLCSVEVLLEGFDDPDVDCIIMARPTQSRALYTQAIGRALRLPEHNAAKTDALILDVTDNCRKHKLLTACNLLGSREDNANGGDVLNLIRAEEEREKDRQEKIRADRSGPVTWRLESVCPWPGLPSLEGYEPTAPWHDQEASEKQLAMISKAGLKVQKVLTKGECSWLIDQIMALEAAFPAPATRNQEFFLRMNGAWRDGLTKKEAGQLIGRLKQQERPAT